MIDKTPKLDPLFSAAESASGEIPSMFAGERAAALPGTIHRKDVASKTRELQMLDVDEYVRLAVAPSEDSRRLGAQAVIRSLDAAPRQELDMGPLYAAEILLPFPGGIRRPVGILAQERSRRNGVWKPEHHRAAVDIIRDFASRRIPVVTFMDTPGADAGADANRKNQAHSISRLIAEFARLEVPNVGVILGNGYSGGAIPLATANILLCMRDGVFNTIQPRGLASIARKYSLSWQECARSVGVSSYELCMQGVIDAVIDFAPGENLNLPNLAAAVAHAITAVEDAAKDFVRSTPEAFEQYRRSVLRYLDPSERLQKLQEASLTRPVHPEDQPNIFGNAFRHLRYLELRRRLHSTTVAQYSRLSNDDVPLGDLARRMEEESESAFRSWLEHPLEIRYDGTLAHAWRRFLRRRTDLGEGYGRWHRILFGNPENNFRTAARDLVLVFGFHLLNQWKGSAENNFMSLARYLNEAGMHDAVGLENPTILDVLLHDEIRPMMSAECGNFVIFDRMYNLLLAGMRDIAQEVLTSNAVERESVARMFEQSLQNAAADLDRSGAGSIFGPDWRK